jgi:fructokinase
MPGNFLQVKGPTSSCSGSGFITLDIVISERSPIPKFYAGGSCGNILTILAYLGWKSIPIARIGNDIAGDIIVRDMKSWGVDVSFIQRDETVLSPIILERIRISGSPRHKFEMACPFCGTDFPRRKPMLLRSLDQLRSKLPTTEVFYFDRVSPSILSMAREQRKNGALIVFEPVKFKRDAMFEDCLKVADIVKHCYAESMDTSSLGVDIPLEIETMSEQGLRYRTNLDKNRGWTTMRAFPIGNLVDSAGAGDWCTAGIVYTLCNRRTLLSSSRKQIETALNVGQGLAAINCHFEGARGPMYVLGKRKLGSILEQLLKGEPVDFTEMTGSYGHEVHTSAKQVQNQLCLCNQKSSI